MASNELSVRIDIEFSPERPWPDTEIAMEYLYDHLNDGILDCIEGMDVEVTAITFQVIHYDE